MPDGGLATEDSETEVTKLLPSELLPMPLPARALQWETTGLLLRKARMALIPPVLPLKGTPFRLVVLSPVIYWNHLGDFFKTQCLSPMLGTVAKALAFFKSSLSDSNMTPGLRTTVLGLSVLERFLLHDRWQKFI